MRGRTAAQIEFFTPVTFFNYVEEQKNKGAGGVAWLVEVYATWAQPCVTFEPLFCELSLQYTTAGFKFGKVRGCGGAELGRWAGAVTSTERGRRALPKNGNEAERVTGGVQAAAAHAHSLPGWAGDRAVAARVRGRHHSAAAAHALLSGEGLRATEVEGPHQPHTRPQSHLHRRRGCQGTQEDAVGRALGGRAGRCACDATGGTRAGWPPCNGPVLIPAPHEACGGVLKRGRRRGRAAMPLGGAMPRPFSWLLAVRLRRPSVVRERQRHPSRSRTDTPITGACTRSRTHPERVSKHEHGALRVVAAAADDVDGLPLGIPGGGIVHPQRIEDLDLRVLLKSGPRDVDGMGQRRQVELCRLADVQQHVRLVTLEDASPSPVAPRFETVSVGERLQAGSSVVQGLPLVDVGLLVQPVLHVRRSAHGAVGAAAAELDRLEAARASIEEQHTVGQRLPEAAQHLEGLHGLHHADDARHDANHARVRAPLAGGRRRRLREEAAVARAIRPEVVHRALPLEANCSAEH
eukprot:scaffold1298_cov382-Prasinococcus_capsulatus_cf.AAC.23